ncbi:hypothetical protein BJV77DRAFT_1068305 [Russula vinacea]|nr:hypothetical protein BJV77DRAFT_1068305 [Russula vinacea]
MDGATNSGLREGSHGCEKQVAQVGKTLKSAEKDEGKAEKATQKAQRAREKAVKQEHKTAQALTDAQHKHDLAVANEKKAVNDLSLPPVNRVHASSRRRWLRLALQMCQRLLQEAHQTVASRRTELEQVQRQKDSGDVARAERLRQAQRGTASGAASG